MAKLGVYKIYFISCPDMIYIGSTIDIARRKRNHLNGLRKHNHNNIILQNYFNKYGENEFTFEVLEIVLDSSLLTQREQFYIDLFNPKLNVLKKAYSILGYKHSEEVKKKLHDININHKMTAEQNLKNSMAQRGNKNALNSKRSKETRLKIRIARQKPVVNIKNNIVVESVGVLSELLCIKYQTLYAQLSGANSNATDWRFL